MITTIRPKGQKLEFTTQATIKDENIKKLESENIQKSVHAWEKDNNVKIGWAEGHIYVISVVPTGDQNTIRKMEETTIEFLKWIDSITLEQAQVPAQINQDQDNKDVKFVKELLDTWDETETLAQTSGATIMCEIAPGFHVPCGNISESLLKEMCISFLKIRDQYE